MHAHRYFAEQARDWLLANRSVDAAEPADQLDPEGLELLKLMLIDLTADRHARYIYET